MAVITPSISSTTDMSELIGTSFPTYPQLSIERNLPICITGVMALKAVALLLT